MSQVDLMKQLTTLPGATHWEERLDGNWMDAPDLDVVAMAHLMLQKEVRLCTMTAISLKDDETEIIYHYALGGQAFNIKVKTKKNTLMSITPVTAAADWVEREIFDLYAVTFTGHPNPVRLLRPSQLKPGYFREPGGAEGQKLQKQQEV